jgi:hypothetical protein
VREGEIGLASSHVATCSLCQKALEDIDLLSLKRQELPQQQVPAMACPGRIF